jgi:hypothetical protein
MRFTSRFVPISEHFSDLEFFLLSKLANTHLGNPERNP